jgi:uncharacterized OB-fold protein
METRVASQRQLPVAQGLFQGTGDAARLIGSHCTSCGAHHFPKSLSCRNPQCSDKQVQDALLSRHGTLYSYTLQAYRPPPLFRMDDWAPYAIGLVELPEGLRIMGMLSHCEPGQIRIGMALELCIEPLYLDEQGQQVLTYKFRPATTAEDTP